MSNLSDDQNRASMDEPTKTMPAIEPQPQTVRHRRSERRAHQTEHEEIDLVGARDEQPAARPSAPDGQEQAGFGQPVRIPPQASRERTSMPARPSADDLKSRGTPRPKALDRVNAQGAAPRQGGTQAPARSSELRRPVNAPGYTRQEPLGRAYDVPAPRASAPQRENRPVQEEEPEERGGRGRGLIIALIILLVIALLGVGIYLIPENATGALGSIRQTVRGAISGLVGSDPTEAPNVSSDSHVLEFYSDKTNAYIPADVTFYLVTDTAVTDVRLFDTDGQTLEGIVDSNVLEDGRVEWSIQVSFETPYWGNIRPQIFTTDWEDTRVEKQINISEETVMETSTAAPTMAVVTDILDFSASPSQGTAPVNIAFSMTTNLNITKVRLVDEAGDELVSEASVLIDNASTRIWALNHTFETAYSGLVRAQAMIDNVWMDSNKLVTLAISGPTMTATPIVTASPTPAPELPADTQEADGTDAVAVDDLDDSEAVYDMPEDWGDDLVEEETVVEETPAPFVTQAPLVDNAIMALPLEVSPTPAPMDMADSGTTEEQVIVDEEVIVDDEVVVDEPAAEPTPAPTEESPATEAPQTQPVLTVTADASADPALIKNAVIYSGTKKVSTYDRAAADIVNMPDADLYERQPYGVMTFRGSSFRQNAAEGNVGNISDMEVLWKTEASSVKSSGKTVFYGIGWTGQPLIIKWSKEVREMSNIYPEQKETKALREVIIAGEDGNIYFLNLENGEKTRDTIALGYPMRGTPSVHALGFPVMSVGQYARKMAKGTGDIGMRVYNLLNSKQAFMIDGLDGKLDRPYYTVGSFETSSLFDYNSDTMITAGTNGMLYLTKLNTTIDRTAATLSVNPSHVSLKTKASGESDKQVAVESSIAAYQNYVFYADMGGVLRCVDTSSMTTLWAVKTDDAVEAAVALDLVDDGNTLWLYTANTLQNRSKGDCTIRRYNALTGAVDWEYKVPVKKNSKSGITAGVKASPVIGRNELDGLVYFTVSLATDIDGSAAQGVLLALEKDTGKLAWSRPLSSYSYSSPVAVYREDGKGWVIQAAHDGTIELLDGLTGAVVSRLQIEGEINASPAVYKNMLVLGTQGKGTSNIYGISLK